MDSIVVNVPLRGAIGGLVKHSSHQKNTVKIGNYDITKEILHTDRGYMKCFKTFKISENVVNGWIYSCPESISEKEFKKMSKHQKIMLNLSSFDEGLGVSYEFIN